MSACPSGAVIKAGHEQSPALPNAAVGATKIEHPLPPPGACDDVRAMGSWALRVSSDVWPGRRASGSLGISRRVWSAGNSRSARACPDPGSLDGAGRDSHRLLHDVVPGSAVRAAGEYVVLVLR